MIRLDYRDARPIYEQVRDGLRSMMVTGVLAAGDKLPSVRSLATELAINPNTIQRAYTQLEAEGYVYTVSGRGTFVSEGQEQNRQRRREVTARVLPLMARCHSRCSRSRSPGSGWPRPRPAGCSPPGRPEYRNRTRRRCS